MPVELVGGKSNSIDRIAFCITFNRTFVDEDFVSGLEQKRAAFLEGRAEFVHINDGQTFKGAGFRVRGEPSDKPIPEWRWAVDFVDNAIIFIANSFACWSTDWPFAKANLSAALDTLVNSDVNVDEILIHVNNLFGLTRSESESSLIAADLFALDTDYLPSNLLKVHKGWHLNQAWVDNHSDDVFKLAIGGLEGSDDNHLRIGVEFSSTRPSHFHNVLVEDLKNEESEWCLEKILKSHYENNSRILKSLLSEEAKDLIGLGGT